MNKEFLQNLREQIKAGTVTEQEPMNKHTSFAIGGPADVFVQPATREEIRSAVYCAKEAGIPFFVMGNGSNLLVSDEGFRGMIIQIGKNFQAISVKDTVIEVLCLAEQPELHGMPDSPVLSLRQESLAP